MPENCPGPSTTPRTRAKARHILDNYYIGPARDDAVLEIWGYTPKMSYAPGERVALHVSTTASDWELEVGRDGLEYRPLLRETGLKGTHRRTPEDCSATGCGWPVSYEFDIPDDWPPGGYLISMRARRGDDLVEEHHVFLLRSLKDFAPQFALVCATGTWLAYNCWGGSNHYESIAGQEGNAFSPTVSTQRPWSRGFCKLPKGALRPLERRPARPGEMARYPYMEWAYAYGYSKKCASAGWASYERHFARWAEGEGYELDAIAQRDLHRDPDLLSRYAWAIAAYEALEVCTLEECDIDFHYFHSGLAGALVYLAELYLAEGPRNLLESALKFYHSAMRAAEDSFGRESIQDDMDAVQGNLAALTLSNDT